MNCFNAPFVISFRTRFVLSGNAKYVWAVGGRNCGHVEFGVVEQTFSSESTFAVHNFKCIHETVISRVVLCGAESWHVAGRV